MGALAADQTILTVPKVSRPGYAARQFFLNRKYQMTNHFALGMLKATALTRDGKLSEATALIQSLLNQTPTAEPSPDDTIIEGSFTRVDDESPRPASKPKHKARPAEPKRNRSSLGQTLGKIRAGGMPARAPFSEGVVPVPSGAKFVTLAHANRRDQRDYKLYIPAARSSKPLPLIVMLHGCTQSPNDFAIGTGMNALAEQHGFLVAYPGQPIAANANKCWNWFKPEDQGRDGGEPELVAGIVGDIIRDQSVDSARVYIAGLSAGGAAAAIVAAAYPDLFSAVGVHSGLPVGAATDIPQAFSAMRNGAKGKPLTQSVPTIVVHGTADNTVNPDNGKSVVDQTLSGFGALDTIVGRGVSEGGRPFRQTRHSDADGRSMCEHWEIEGAGHAWAGGARDGSYTDPAGPSASEEMVRFFFQHSKG